MKTNQQQMLEAQHLGGVCVAFFRGRPASIVFSVGLETVPSQSPASGRTSLGVLLSISTTLRACATICAGSIFGFYLA
jgi:hypothetical protein